MGKNLKLGSWFLAMLTMLAILSGVVENGVSSTTSSSSPPIKNGAAIPAAPNPVSAALPKLNSPALFLTNGDKNLPLSNRPPIPEPKALKLERPPAPPIKPPAK